MEDYAALLKAIRAKRGITQEELAARLSITQGYVSYIESGTMTPKRHVKRIIDNFVKVTHFKMPETTETTD